MLLCCNLIRFVSGQFDLPEHGCRVIKVKAIQQGHTKVKVAYSARGVDLSASVTIAAYDPLMVRATK